MCCLRLEAPARGSAALSARLERTGAHPRCQPQARTRFPESFEATVSPDPGTPSPASASPGRTSPTGTGRGRSNSSNPTLLRLTSRRARNSFQEQRRRLGGAVCRLLGRIHRLPRPARAYAFRSKWVRLWSSALRVGRRGCGRTDLEPGPIAVWLSDSELPPGINPGGSQSSTACARGGQPQPLANHAPRRASRGDGQRAVGGCGVVGDDQRRDGAHSGREIADRRPSR
jgi:hypothetical protein